MLGIASLILSDSHLRQACNTATSIRQKPNKTLPLARQHDFKRWAKGIFVFRIRNLKTFLTRTCALAIGPYDRTRRLLSSNASRVEQVAVENNPCQLTGGRLLRCAGRQGCGDYVLHLASCIEHDGGATIRASPHRLCALYRAPLRRRIVWMSPAVPVRVLVGHHGHTIHRSLVPHVQALLRARDDLRCFSILILRHVS